MMSSNDGQFFNYDLFKQVYRFEWGLITISAVAEVLVYLYTPRWIYNRSPVGLGLYARAT